MLNATSSMQGNGTDAVGTYISLVSIKHNAIQKLKQRCIISFYLICPLVSLMYKY